MSSSDSSSDSRSSPSITHPSSLPPSPKKRRQSEWIRNDPVPVGIAPASLIGKTLVSISRSSTHPNVVLQFSDGSSYQVRVDGYSPQYPGIQKELELSDRCAEVFPVPGGCCEVDLTIDHCAAITLLDKGFDGRGSRESSWDKDHAALAFRFKEREGWHCLWAMLVEREEYGRCIYRNFQDVYLVRSPPRSPRKKR